MLSKPSGALNTYISNVSSGIDETCCCLIPPQHSLRTYISSLRRHTINRTNVGGSSFRIGVLNIDKPAVAMIRWLSVTNPIWQDSKATFEQPFYCQLFTGNCRNMDLCQVWKKKCVCVYKVRLYVQENDFF